MRMVERFPRFAFRDARQQREEESEGGGRRGEERERERRNNGIEMYLDLASGFT